MLFVCAMAPTGVMSVCVCVCAGVIAGGPDSRPRRSPCRDLNLSYALASANSPDLPIFGRSAATPQAAATTTAGLQQHQALETPLAGQYEGGGGGDGGAAAADDDSTRELYSSLIHSNLGGRRGAVDSTPDAEGKHFEA